MSALSLRAAQVVNVVLVGVLAGNEFGSWAAVHPALGTLQPKAHVAAEAALTRRYGMLMPWLMTGALASCAPLLARLDPRQTAFRLVLAAAASLASMLGVTLLGNVPVNRRVLAASPSAPPDDWAALRARWDRLHSVRQVLNFTAFVCVALAAVSRQR